MTSGSSPFGDTEVEYPVEILMKVITHAGYPETRQKTAITSVLTSLDLSPDGWRQKESGAGKYISHSFYLVIQNKTQLHSLYSMLNDLEEVKMLL